MVNQKETNKGGFCPYESVVLVLEKMRKENVASASQRDGPAAFQYRLLGPLHVFPVSDFVVHRSK